jgi:hypothetical protein
MSDMRASSALPCGKILSKSSTLLDLAAYYKFVPPLCVSCEKGNLNASVRRLEIYVKLLWKKQGNACNKSKNRTYVLMRGAY